MTIKEYEEAGGFKKELQHLVDIGRHMVALTELIPTRPNRPDELNAFAAALSALEHLRDEILRTRHGEVENEPE